MERTTLSASPANESGTGAAVLDEQDVSGNGAATATAAATPHRPDAAGDHAGHGHEDVIDLNVPPPRPWWVIAAAVAGVGILAALLVIGLVPRHEQANELQADAAAAENAPVLVNIAKPVRAAETVQITIPGTLRPWQEVSIYARTAGYLKKFYVDISNQVEAGQLLAEIDTPEVNQELRQSQAALLQTKAAVTKATADRDLAKVTWGRYQQLTAPNYVSQQEADEKQAALHVAESALESAQANVTAAEANVQRLTEMQSFQKVYAPFAGVITGRGYDVGSLIIANPTATDVKPMYKIAENDVLRAFVNVPQSASLQITKGMDVKVTVRERPGRSFAGKVMGTTNYLDPANRSLLTEVKVTNVREPGGEFALLPGMYVQVSFEVKRTTPPLVVPGPAVVNDAQGTQVAVVRGDGTAHFQKVTLGQDFGKEVEIVEGLTGDEQVITNPGERVVEGAVVRASGGEGNAGGGQHDKVAAAGGK
jgi:RND family efflux transporter MFP subunit